MFDGGLYFVMYVWSCDCVLCSRNSDIYNMNIYFKVVVVQIQASELFPRLGSDPSHPGAAPKAPHPKV